MTEKEPIISPKHPRDQLDGLRSDIERESLSPFLQKLDQEIFSKMKYDDLNYSLAYQFDDDTPINRELSRIPEEKRSISDQHKTLLINTLAGYARTERYDRFSIEQVIRAIKETHRTRILIEYPSLQRLLISDRAFSSAYDAIYQSKTLPEKIRMGVGNCNTFTDMAIELLSQKDQKNKLGIQSIQRVNNPLIDHTFLIIKTARGKTISYDPTLALMTR